MRKGRVLSVTTFREEEAEAIELIASERSKYVGKKVEVTGSSDHKGGASADTSASSTRAGASMTGPQFHVKSVRVIAENCS